MSTRFSPDGLYYWDGVQWVSTISHDGRSRWDGASWVPLQTPLYVPYAESRPPARQPTSWTRPLQIAVIANYTLAALYSATLPFTMGGVMNQVVNQSLQQQQNLYATPPPAGFTDMMNAMITFGFGIGAVFAVAIAVVAIIASLKRWAWAYYVIMVWFGLAIFGLFSDAIGLAAGSFAGIYGGIALPAWIYIAGLVTSAINVALFVWMLVALVKRGPWGMVRPAS